MTLRICHFFAASLLLWAWVCLTSRGFAEPAPPVRPGMSPEQVRERLGPPARVARQILSQRYLEQWLYDAPHHLRLEFDCPRGQPARLVSVQANDQP